MIHGCLTSSGTKRRNLSEISIFEERVRYKISRSTKINKEVITLFYLFNSILKQVPLLTSLLFTNIFPL